MAEIQRKHSNNKDSHNSNAAEFGNLLQYQVYAVLNFAVPVK